MLVQVYVTAFENVYQCTALSLANNLLMNCMLQLPWDLRAEDPLEYSCVVEALMAAWVGGNLPAPAAAASVPYAHQASDIQQLYMMAAKVTGWIAWPKCSGISCISCTVACSLIFRHSMQLKPQT